MAKYLVLVSVFWDSQMLPPFPLFEVCNQTLVVNNTFQRVMAPNDTYFACSSGLTTFIVTSTFLKGREY